MNTEEGYITVAPKEYNTEHHSSLASSLLIVTGKVIEAKKDKGILGKISDPLTLANVIRLLQLVETRPDKFSALKEIDSFLAAVIKTGYVYESDGSFKPDFKLLPDPIREILTDPNFDLTLKQAMIDGIKRLGKKYYLVKEGSLEGINNIDDLIRTFKDPTSDSESSTYFQIPELRTGYYILFPEKQIKHLEDRSYSFLMNVVLHLRETPGSKIKFTSTKKGKLDLNPHFKDLGANSETYLKTKLTRIFGCLLNYGSKDTYLTSLSEDGLNGVLKIRYKSFNLVFNIEYVMNPDDPYFKHGKGFGINNIKGLEISLERREDESN